MNNTINNTLTTLTKPVKLQDRGAQPFHGEGQNEKWPIGWGPRVLYLLTKLGQSRCTPCLHTKHLQTDSDFTHFKFFLHKINGN